MQKSNRSLSLLLILLAIFLLTFVDGALKRRHWADGSSQHKSLVMELGITDLTFFTEARYSRHLTQADRHAPFQDHPVALEHFPSGSLTPPQNPEARSW